tara:strand:- start:73 stop:588 length:516 start_codon:yes stop_codon:yes gene_type:complete
VNKLLLLLPIMIFPLLAIAEEIVVSPAYIPKSKVLDLTYNLPLDPYFCDNNPELCKKIDIERLPKFDMTPRATNGQWLAFWTFQLLDVYSTSRALKYDCIKEVNPLFTDTPSDFRLVATKGLLLLPGLLHNDNWTEVTKEELDGTNMLYLAIVGNNFRLLNQAKRECNKIN